MMMIIIIIAIVISENEWMNVDVEEEEQVNLGRDETGRQTHEWMVSGEKNEWSLSVDVKRERDMDIHGDGWLCGQWL